MKSHVTFKTRLGQELLAAVTTQKLLLPSLVDDLIMFDQCLLSLEPFPTPGGVAYERKDVRVTDKMAGQV